MSILRIRDNNGQMIDVPLLKGDKGEPGENGIDGLTPFINDNGNWQIGDIDTGVKAVGTDGKDGVDGTNGKDGADGKDGVDGVDGADGIDGADGKDGVGITKVENINNELIVTLSDGNTFNLGNVKGANGKDGSDGKDGVDGTNGTDGKNGVDGIDGVGIESVTIIDNELIITLTDKTEVNLGNIKGADGKDGNDGTNGKDGTDGIDGKDGLTPFINSDGNWQIGDTNTGVKAEGINGDKGDSAYQIAVKKGFEGTEAEWLVSLKGDKGEQGDSATNIITSVNGKTGDVNLTAEEVGALSKEDVDQTYSPESENAQSGKAVAEAIAKVNVQLTPEFVNDISECTDTTKLYVLPDGYIYAYMIGEGQKEEATFGTVEWGAFSPVSTTGEDYVFSHIGASISGELKSISVKCDAVATVKFAVAHMGNGVVTSVDDIYITTKVGENTYVNGVDFYYDGIVQKGDLIGCCRDISCKIYYGTSADEWCYRTTSLSDYSLTAKTYGFAISAIVETSAETEYMWRNTGHTFTPTDYEDRIIELEKDVADLKQNGSKAVIATTGTEIEPSIPNYADSEAFVISVKPSTTSATLTMEKSENINTSAVRQICYVDFTNGKIGFYNKSSDGATLTIHREKALSFSIVSGHEFVVEMIKRDSKYAILKITDAYSLESDEISCSEYEVGRGWGSRKYTYTGDTNDITSVKSYIMQQKKTKLLIVGDSYIEGSSLPEFGEDRNNRYAMLLKNAVGGDCFINGRGGAASANILSWFNTYLPEVCQPEYTIVSCGGNDGNYDNWVARYNAIIAKIEEMGSKPILTTVAAIGVGACKDIFGQMNEWIRNRGYDYIDVNLVTSLNYEGTELNPEYVFPDNVHPNSVGHDIIFKRAQIDVPYIFRNNSQTASREYVDNRLGDIDTTLDGLEEFLATI